MVFVQKTDAPSLHRWGRRGSHTEHPANLHVTTGICFWKRNCIFVCLVFSAGKPQEWGRICSWILNWSFFGLFFSCWPFSLAGIFPKVGANVYLHMPSCPLSQFAEWRGGRSTSQGEEKRPSRPPSKGFAWTSVLTFQADGPETDTGVQTQMFTEQQALCTCLFSLQHYSQGRWSDA